MPKEAGVDCSQLEFFVAPLARPMSPSGVVLVAVSTVSMRIPGYLLEPGIVVFASISCARRVEPGQPQTQQREPREEPKEQDVPG